MYMWGQVVPSLLWGGRFSSIGICPLIPAPTVSMSPLPTSPVVLAIPSGNRPDFELSMIREVSQALAASTTIRARTCLSVRVALST